jgi:hypothetical protein
VNRSLETKAERNISTQVGSTAEDEQETKLGIRKEKEKGLLQGSNNFLDHESDGKGGEKKPKTSIDTPRPPNILVRQLIGFCLILRHEKATREKYCHDEQKKAKMNRPCYKMTCRCPL